MRPERLELPTLGSEDRCSIQLSYGRVHLFSTIYAESIKPTRAFFCQFLDSPSTDVCLGLTYSLDDAEPPAISSVSVPHCCVDICVTHYRRDGRKGFAAIRRPGPKRVS